MDPADKIGPILKLLDQHYREAHVTLDFTNPLELLVATVLSAQCTDVRVNQVTPAIFKQYPTAAHYADAPLADLEQAFYWSATSLDSVWLLCRREISPITVPASHFFSGI